VLPPLSQPRQSKVGPVTPAPKSKKQKRAKPSLLAKRVNPLFDGEAAHSGDEESEGLSGSEEEDEYDRSFIKDSPMTQMSPSYEQTQIYRQSLLTQAPGGGGRQPLFANGPARSRPFGRLQPKKQVYLLSSSPPPDGEDEPNEYEHGSFVVGDDDLSMEAAGSDDAFLDL
jgi:ATP-dependent DNA helicase MPH1